MKAGLYAFEGPDGAGKTSLARALATHLNESGQDTEVIAMSGELAGTFAEHVYKLYHDPNRFGVNYINVISEQLLFTAGHADVIDRKIKPALAAGKIVLLDRYWWSTWVYATAGGLAPRIRDLLIALELEVLGDIRPSLIFLVHRCHKNNSKLPSDRLGKLTLLYNQLSKLEHSSPVRIVDIANDGTLKETLASVLQAGFSNNL